MPQRERKEAKPEGWRSTRKLGSLSLEKQEAKSRPLGKVGRNSGRQWDERGGNDFTLGSRGKPIAISVDLKQTVGHAYMIAHDTLANGRAKAGGQGYEFALQIQFYDRNSNAKIEDVTVIPTALFDEMMKGYGKKAKPKLKKK